jgi:hypothetical protein
LKQRIKRFLPIIVGLGLLLNPQLSMLAQTLEEQTVLAALALNIVRFTTWPSDDPAHSKATVDFCVIGDNVVQQSFANIDHKAVGNKTLAIVYLTRMRNFEQCQALYVSELKQNVLQQVFVEIKKRPLLTIGEDYEFVELGGMVGLENIDGKMTIHVNLPVVRESKLNISARLLKLAKIIGN